MSDRSSSSDLGSSAEAVLSAFPFPERDWERDARAIEARLSDGARDSTEALLLAPVLLSESGEPSSTSTSATTTPLTNSGVRTQSLAEIARRSVERKQATERQMARETLAIAAAEQRNRAARNELPQAPSVAPSAPSSTREVPRVSGLVAKSESWSKVALALPVLGLAAAALFWFKRPEATPAATPPVANVVVESAASAVAARPTHVPDVPRGIDPNTLPGEVAAVAEAAPAKVASAGSTTESAPAKAAASKGALKDNRATAAAGAVEKSLPPDPGLRPADSRSGELPAKPSTGAVQAALGSVMGGARHCVAGDDAPSRAVVVFGSDGRVQQVTVSGAAAGKSSAACIEAQLSRARVQPFAASNFSVNATVRPE